MGGASASECWGQTSTQRRQPLQNSSLMVTVKRDFRVAIWVSSAWGGPFLPRLPGRSERQRERKQGQIGRQWSGRERRRHREQHHRQAELGGGLLDGGEAAEEV